MLKNLSLQRQRGREMEGRRHNDVTFVTFNGKNENKKAPPQKKKHPKKGFPEEI